MNYPLISEYVAAIKDAAGNLDKLANLKPVLDNDDEPIHSSGAFAVVFKMVDDNGKYYALKCFTEEQTGRAEAYKLIADELEIVNSSYMLNVEYYDKELFVDSNVTEDTEFPVLLMDWVDGETMDWFIADNYADEYEMSWLCYRFCKMAAWLRSQPFAHGDLKPDNIIVREDGELVLIDYDGMFVPAMKGRKSPTLGTKDFVHSNRKVDDFDETIDDFTLASIALSLKAISLDSSLYEKFAKPDRLLFSSTDYLDLSKCEMMKKLCEFMGNLDLVRLTSLFEYSLALGNLSSVSFRSFVLAKPAAAKPCKYTLEELKAMSEVTYKELDEIDWDETGAKYSKDGKRLLRVRTDARGAFSIRKGTLVVCNYAFYECIGLTGITIPESVKSIGDGAFYVCKGLTEITIPENVTSIGDGAFFDCRGLTEITIPKSVKSIGNKAFYRCSGLTEITIPENVTSIGDSAFYDCRGLTEITIPESVTSIGDGAFSWCSGLTEITIPESVTSIGDNAFSGCSLTEITIPESVTSIGAYAFSGCSGLTEITIPKSVISIGDNAFAFCSGLTEITIPENVTSIGDSAFYDCSGLTSIKVDIDNIVYDSRNNCNAIIESKSNKLICACKSSIIPESVTSIGDNAFYRCIRLTEITIPKSVTSIGAFAFSSCSGLTEITIPESVTRIGDKAFYRCIRLTEITIPESVTSIGAYAFCVCKGLTEITIPESVTSIGAHAFDSCFRLRRIRIPLGTRDKFIKMLGMEFSRLIVEQ